MEESPGGGTAPEITVAICTLDRRNDLLTTLDALSLQDTARSWEVLIVDNGCQDGSPDAIRDREHEFPVPLRYVREEKRGISHARNRALREARGRVIVFVDDDMSPQPGWLDGHGRAFDEPSLAVSGGRIEPMLPDNTPDWLREEFAGGVGGPAGRYDLGPSPTEIRLGNGQQLPFTGNLGVRRKVAVEIGGFRTDLGWSPDGRRIGAEDIDLVKRILATGGRVRYLPDACVVHRVQPERVTPEYYRVWNVGYGRSSVLMRPKRSAPVRWSLAVAQILRIVRYSLPTARLGHGRAARVRKRQQAWGRVLQLVCGDASPRRPGGPAGNRAEGPRRV